jgi:hypothetical protein
MAENQNKSIFQIVREILQRYPRESGRENQLKRELNALDQLVYFRNQVQQQHGILNESLLVEVQEERQRDIGF